MSPSAPFFRTYIHQVSKIIEGAANADYSKVCAYAEKLSQELEAHGEKESAKRVRDGIRNGKAHKLVLAKTNPKSALEDFRVPLDSESRLPIADLETINPDQVPVHLSAATHSVLDEFISFCSATDQLVAHGVPMRATMLLYGPPGCGKTHTARWLAGKLNLPLLTARTDSIISSYLGSTAKNIRLLFEHAMSQPCVLFLDEFDALAKMRDDSRELGELKRVVISLLQNIDVFSRDHVLIAATNHQHLLDPAIWRRFNYEVAIGFPGEEARMKILEDIIKDYAESDLKILLARISQGASGASLKTTSETLLRRAIVQKKSQIDSTDSVSAFIKLNSEFKDVDCSNVSELLPAVQKLTLNHFTQAQLAKVFGISQSRVSKLLNPIG